MTDLSKPKETSGRSRKSWGMWAAYLGFLVVFAWPYLFLGSVLVQVKTDRSVHPQPDYIDAVYEAAAYAKREGEEGGSISARVSRYLPFYTNGIIDPLWPWIMGGSSDLPPDALYEKGKWVNLISCAVLLLLFGVAAGRAFSFVGAAAMVLMGGFGGLLERSTFFSSDALYYLLVVLTWLCALSLIRQNPLWLYGVFGFLLGLSYLAKPFIWPLVVGFVFVSIARSITTGIRNQKRESVDDLWVPTNQLVGAAMAITAFLIVAGPRLSYAAEQFGDPFHSYLRYFMWVDSPGDAVRFRQENPGEAELAKLKSSEKPGFIQYVTENGLTSLVDRGTAGAIEQSKASVFGRRGGILVYVFFVFLVVAFVHRWAVHKQDEEVWLVRGTSARWMFLFLVLVIAMTLFYAGIGNRIFPSNTMTTSLFLPVLITFIWIAERYRRQLQRSHYAKLVNIVYSCMMALPILWITIKIVRDVSRLLG